MLCRSPPNVPKLHYRFVSQLLRIPRKVLTHESLLKRSSKRIPKMLRCLHDWVGCTESIIRIDLWIISDAQLKLSRGTQTTPPVMGPHWSRQSGLPTRPL